MSVTASLFVIVKKWEQPNCPSIDTWKNKMCYIHTILFSHIKGKGQIHATTRIHIDCVLLTA